MMLESNWKRGGLGASAITAPPYTEREETVLQVLTLVFSSLSILTTMLTSYWFLIMRRSFRHHLLMILVQSDMFKALWFMIYAIDALTSGTTESASIFCQVSGFFTTAGFELSVLMIAVHSALCIFKAQTSIGEGGLYPYRYIAYVLWFGLPLLMASLAFTNPTGAYISSGTSCYLPVRPFWYRLALGWVPRYLIFLFILGTDVSIYFYVKRKFGDFGKNSNSSAQQTRRHNFAEGGQVQNQPGRGNQRFSLPETPPLAYHGLMPETREPSLVSREELNGSAPNEQPQSRTKTVGNPSLFKWAKIRFSRQFSKITIHPKVPTLVPARNDADRAVETSAIERTAAAVTPSGALIPVSGAFRSSQTSWTTFAAQFNTYSPSKTSVLPFLRLKQRYSSSCSEGLAPITQLESVDSQGHSFNEASLMEARSKIKQQMQFLFIYPLAYMAMWALPFIAHTLQYDDYYAANPPFLLSAVSTVITVSQSMVDCWIFNIKEKPWRQPAKQGRSAIQGLAHLEGLKFKWERPRLRRAGKSKAAMGEEARFAYQRRDEERAARASEMGSVGRSDKRERSWWDEIDDMTETTTPLTQESGTALGH